MLLPWSLGLIQGTDPQLARVRFKQGDYAQTENVAARSLPPTA